MVLHCHFTFDFAVLFIDHAYKLCPRELSSFYFGKYLCITFIYFGGVRITSSSARTSRCTEGDSPENRAQDESIFFEKSEFGERGSPKLVRPVEHNNNRRIWCSGGTTCTRNASLQVSPERKKCAPPRKYRQVLF